MQIYNKKDNEIMDYIEGVESLDISDDLNLNKQILAELKSKADSINKQLMENKFWKSKAKFALKKTNEQINTMTGVVARAQKNKIKEQNMVESASTDKLIIKQIIKIHGVDYVKWLEKQAEGE